MFYTRLLPRPFLPFTPQRSRHNEDNYDPGGPFEKNANTVINHRRGKPIASFPKGLNYADDK